MEATHKEFLSVRRKGSPMLGVNWIFVFAEGQAMQRVTIYMKDWIDKLHAFLQINNKNILKDAGKISHELATEMAEKNFEEY